MKPLVIFSFLFLATFLSNAQSTQFGVTAGVIYVKGEGRFEERVATRSETGFYAGGIVDISISDKFHVQPEVVLAASDEGGAMFVPIMAKYYLISGLSIQGGPQFDYTFEQIPDNFTSLGIAAALGIGYDISQRFFVEARYSFQLNDYYTGDLDATATVNNLLVGIGYKFN